MALSVAGTIFQGYFFAFHLLNIVNNNQLLKGVIQAVTKNGNYLKSNKSHTIIKPIMLENRCRSHPMQIRINDKLSVEINDFL